MDYLKGISSAISTHRIFLEEGAQPSFEYQRRLKPQMKEVVRKEITRLQDTRIIYHVKESDWVSPVHCVPKKGGFMLVADELNEVIPTRTVVGHMMCIYLRKLNKETRKDHYPLKFIDQTLEKQLNILTFIT
jgi:SAM-dependent MidA family methyltransferase